MRPAIYSFLLFALLGISACDITDNEVEPGVSFSRIYDDAQFGGQYDPLDIVPLADSGYLILAATNEWNIYLLKTDQDGFYEWEMEVDEAFVNPLSSVIQQDNHYFFFCMNEVTLGTHVMQISLDGQAPTEVAEFPEIQYPLNVSLNQDGSLLVLGYNRETRSSTLHKLNAGLEKEWSQEYRVEEDVEEPIIKHLSRLDRRLPFFVGESQENGGFYFFNGFANYTLSMVFVNPQNGESTGTLNGFRDGSYLSAARHLQANQFALARSSFGQNTLMPNMLLDASAVGSSNDLEANDFPEIDEHAKVLIKEITLGEQAIILYGTHSKQRQLMLYAYDKLTGELLGTKHLGQSQPYEMGNFALTPDGGLIVLAETFLTGRFSRLTLFKLSQEEFEGFIRR